MKDEQNRRPQHGRHVQQHGRSRKGQHGRHESNREQARKNRAHERDENAVEEETPKRNVSEGIEKDGRGSELRGERNGDKRSDGFLDPFPEIRPLFDLTNLERQPFQGPRQDADGKACRERKLKSDLEEKGGTEKQQKERREPRAFEQIGLDADEHMRIQYDTHDAGADDGGRKAAYSAVKKQKRGDEEKFYSAGTGGEFCLSEKEQAESV